ncbi:MAG: DUF499 domain-containing protein, partial [Actinomycetia bacterium]|nr:DUF499 domain-containing protein [Actinomycetes bacterium]
MTKSARTLIDEAQQALLGSTINFLKYNLPANIPVLDDLDWQACLQLTITNYNELRCDMPRSWRTYLFEAKDIRNKFAHDHKFTYNETERALGTLLLVAEGLDAAAAVENVKQIQNTFQMDRMRELRSTVTPRQKKNDNGLNSKLAYGLPSWREIITPRDEVINGEFTAATFAINLHDVVHGKPNPQDKIKSIYRDPTRFFDNTYLTAGIQSLLEDAVRRLRGEQTTEIYNIRTSFGGGKTHALLALYHLFSPDQYTSNAVDDLLARNNLNKPEKPVSRAVLVGNGWSPHEATQHPDGTTTHTAWGRLAYQLGGKEAYELFRYEDENAKPPSIDKLRNLFDQFGPCLILLDEWARYLGQIDRTDENPGCGGNYTQNHGFLQTLTEAVGASRTSLLVVSLPQGGIEGNVSETGGAQGDQALRDLESVLKRNARAWSPATPRESFAIVQTRLFKINEMTKEQHAKFDAVMTNTKGAYNTRATIYPVIARQPGYKEELAAAYPIHPTMLSTLSETWAAGGRFQRTRGSLQLIAAIVKSLWENEHDLPFIMLGDVPLKQSEVRGNLLSALQNEQGWSAVIDADIDSDTAIANSIDTENKNTQQMSQRVARTLFMTTAPRIGPNKNENIEKLAVGISELALAAAPPLTINTNAVTDAMLEYTRKGKYVHTLHDKYWFDLDANLNSLAEERAKALHDEEVTLAIGQLLKRETDIDPTSVGIQNYKLGPLSDLNPSNDACLFYFVTSHTHDNTEQSEVMKELNRLINGIMANRNNFIAVVPDKEMYERLEKHVRYLIAWEKLNEKEGNDFRASDQAIIKENVKKYARSTDLILRSTWKWLLHATQIPGENTCTIATSETSRPSADAKETSLLAKVYYAVVKKIWYMQLGPNHLIKDLKSARRWNDNEDDIPLREIANYYAQQPYFLRISKRSALEQTIRDA